MTPERVSAFGIFLFPDRRAGWREAARVLKPGGLLATAVWRGPDDNTLARLQMGPVMAALPERIRAGLPRPGWLDIASRARLEEEQARLEDSALASFNALPGGADRPVRFEASCHFAVARRFETARIEPTTIE